MLNKKAVLILRLGLAITFIWVGVLILAEPEEWAEHLQTWVTQLLPFESSRLMMVIGAVDVIIGWGLLTERAARLAAQAGSIHLIIVLAVAGIDHETVRDIGLLAGTLALAATLHKK
ncbi:MAG: DoxX family membrane protein [Minisyncoccia bacterium]